MLGESALLFRSVLHTDIDKVKKTKLGIKLPWIAAYSLFLLVSFTLDVALFPIYTISILQGEHLFYWIINISLYSQVNPLISLNATYLSSGYSIQSDSKQSDQLQRLARNLLFRL